MSAAVTGALVGAGVGIGVFIAVAGWCGALGPRPGASRSVRIDADRLTARNVVYIANHISMIDIPVLVTAVPVVPKFVMKQELLRVPLFGAAAKAAGHIAIDRRNLAVL